MKEPFGDFRFAINGTNGQRGFARGLVFALPIALVLWALAFWLL
jgi:hypothetical protein